MEFNKTHAIYRVIHYKTVPETKRRNTFLASALLPFPKPFPLTAGTEVSLSVTPAEGATPTASLNGSSVTLTENDGVYSGSFTMPSTNASLIINSGGTNGGGGDAD